MKKLNFYIFMVFFIIFQLAMPVYAFANQENNVPNIKKSPSPPAPHIHKKLQNNVLFPEITTFSLNPSDIGVPEFLSILYSCDPPYKSDYDDEICYNVTPQNITEKYGFCIFKFDKSCSSFLLYNNKVYSLGISFGGRGVTSFAVADINDDGSKELYFTYSWGSGIPRSMIGYFDTKYSSVVLFDYSDYINELVLVNDNNVLSIYSAYEDMKSFVDIKLSVNNKIGIIKYDEEEIKYISL